MKMSTRSALAFVGGAPLLMAMPTEAMTIVSEDWQTPNVSTNTQLDDTATFAGWDFSDGGDNVFKLRDAGAGGSGGLVGGSEGTANQALQFEWDGEFAAYDTTHNWANDDVYNVTFNATEQSWSSGSDRSVTVRIYEVSGVANKQAGALLYSESVLLPQIDSNHDDSGEDWSASQTFSLDFDAGDFSGGTEGTALSFQIGGGGLPGNRGTYVDNISFTLVPEPGSLALLGLGGLLIARRRR